MSRLTEPPQERASRKQVGTEVEVKQAPEQAEVTPSGDNMPVEASADGATEDNELLTKASQHGLGNPGSSTESQLLVDRSPGQGGPGSDSPDHEGHGSNQADIRDSASAQPTELESRETRDHTSKTLDPDASALRDHESRANRAREVSSDDQQPAVTDQQMADRLPQLLIGLGASAGGLQPLEDFFRTVDPDAGHAYVVVQHLSPDFKSLMSELLGRQTRMKVQRAEDGMKVCANNVYLIPPRKELTVVGDELRVEEPRYTSTGTAHFPIDVFFRSLAVSAKSRAVGIIFSGTGSDGSRGVRSIDEAGGLVLVQDPATAQFDGMPKAARATGTTLHALPPNELATLVSDLASDRGTKFAPYERLDQPNEFEKIIALMSKETENDFSAYKFKTLNRRVQRRRMITSTETLADYYQLLVESRDERELLCADLLIHVTSFFRDETSWRCLAEKYLPALIESIPPDNTLRIWVAACSTGEEAYTMAMVVRETMESLGRGSQQLKIFATDVDPSVLERAAAGVYPQSIVADVPVDVLNKYFSADGDNYVASRKLRELIIFAPHNLLADAPFTRTHLVSCRNALIYLRPEAQDRVMSMMHFSLVPNGLLFLGASETIGQMANEFRTLDESSSMYAKLRDIRLSIEPTFRTRGVERGNRGSSASRTAPRQTDRASINDSMLKYALQSIAFERSWVCLLCDGHQNVIHTLGTTDGLLRVPPGELTAEAPRMVPEGLSMPLRSALNRAQRERRTINHTSIRSEGHDGLFDLQVIYRATTRKAAEMSIVVITRTDNKPAVAEGDTHGDTDTHTAQQVQDLEYELRQTRENLQATIEQLETTNEEQQATNEELTSANEELQSTNEELHSVNEELYTVNSEYQQKISELTELTNDMDNLLESTDIGVVFLDSSLQIRKFTPAATRNVHMMPSDVGRSFNDLSYTFDYPDLNADLNRVLSLGEAIEREVKSAKAEYLLVRIHPYRAGSELTVGIVITFVNISELKKVEDALAQVETRYRHLFQSEMFGIILGDMSSRNIVDANDAFLGLLQYGRLDLPLPLTSVYAESEHAEIDRALRELQMSGTSTPAPVLLKKADGTLTSVIVGRTLISETDGTYVAFVLATDRLTDQAGVRLQEKAHELETVRDNLQQFAYTSSHQLQEPLRAVTGFTQLLNDEFAEVIGDKGRDYLRYIDDGAKRLAVTIEDLLLFSRVHTHASPMSWIDSAVLVNNVLAQLQNEIQQVDATLDIGSLPVVLGDEPQIRQVFKSIIHNALKFRSKKAPEITVSASKLDGFWRFSIADKGIGIDPASHSRVFTMFETANPDGTASRGIGLAISKRIIERHHGKIWIESAVEKGTKVLFTLPVHSDTGGDSAAGAPPSESDKFLAEPAHSANDDEGNPL